MLPLDLVLESAWIHSFRTKSQIAPLKDSAHGHAITRGGLQEMLQDLTKDGVIGNGMSNQEPLLTLLPKQTSIDMWETERKLGASQN